MGANVMIIPVTGNVKYPITLDASVWIFDDRRIKFEDAFSENLESAKQQEETFKYSSDERFNREVFQATNDNKPIPRKDRDEILTSSYVISFKPFYDNLEVTDTAKEATIVQTDGNEITLTLKELEESYFQFSYLGKPLQEDGPVHIYFKDGSNKEDPVKAVKKIVIQ